MQNQRHEKVRERAYQIWEREGRQDGRAEEHWSQAEQELADTAETDETPASGTNGVAAINGAGTSEAAPAANGSNPRRAAPKSGAPRKRRGSQPKA
jgi:hypothetical protein